MQQNVTATVNALLKFSSGVLCWKNCKTIARFDGRSNCLISECTSIPKHEKDANTVFLFLTSGYRSLNRGAQPSLGFYRLDRTSQRATTNAVRSSCSWLSLTRSFLFILTRCYYSHRLILLETYDRIIWSLERSDQMNL